MRFRDTTRYTNLQAFINFPLEKCLSTSLRVRLWALKPVLSYIFTRSPSLAFHVGLAVHLWRPRIVHSYHYQSLRIWQVDWNPSAFLWTTALEDFEWDELSSLWSRSLYHSLWLSCRAEVLMWAHLVMLMLKSSQ